MTLAIGATNEINSDQDAADATAPSAEPDARSSRALSETVTKRPVFSARRI